MNRALFFILGFAFLSMAGPLHADIVKLKNGNTIEGRVTAESQDAVTLYLGSGTVGIARSEIVEIVKRPWEAPASRKKAEAPAAPEPDLWSRIAGRLDAKTRAALIVLAGLGLFFFLKQKFSNLGVPPLVRFLRKMSDLELLRMMTPSQGTYRDEETLALVKSEWLLRNIPPDRVEKLKAKLEKRGNALKPIPLQAFPESRKKSGWRTAATLGLLLALAGGLALRLKGYFPAPAQEETEPANGTAENKNYPWLSGGIGHAQALKLQEQTGAPMLVYFFTTWCPYCKQFDSGILASPKVGKALAGVIKVKIDAEKETKLSGEYRIGGYPTVLAVRKSGWNKTKRLSTHVSPDQFIADCRNAGLRVR